MNQREVRKLDIGIYWLHWKAAHGGGESLAAVGQTEDGGRWMAPTNWLHPDEAPRCWKMVDYVARAD